MKRLSYIILFLVVVTGLSAQGFTVQFSPRQQVVNSFSTFELDPVNPDSQPFLTNLIVAKQGSAQQFELQLQILWNNAVIIGEGEAIYRSLNSLEQGVPMQLSNQDIIRNQEGLYLHPLTSIDLMDEVKSYPVLEQALMSGYFPDGIMKISVAIRAMDTTIWESSDTFSLVIRNAGAIYLSSPGRQINQVPPKLSHLPLTFIWNAVATSFNDHYLIIKEFDPHDIPQSNTVESRGAVVYHSPGPVNSGFSEYLPFNDGCYYAWQVYTPLHDSSTPYNPEQINGANSKKLSSSWYVFQYREDANEDLSASEIYGILSQLNNERIIRILLQGYRPTGEVILDGRSYKGQDAVDIIESLAGKEFQVEIKD
ncbi:MAG TPA: hypothetical protein PL020_06500 [Candidatus Cloacimonadota bacterium]|nr:hypothetical protein [Candidatus Cloacimonadota bacterium]